MSKELKDFRVEDWYHPVKNYILLEFTTNEKVNGVVIPDALREQKLGLRCISIGPNVEVCKVGDLVQPTPGTQMATFKMFDGEYCQIADYQVFSIITDGYEQAAKEFKELKEKLEKEKLEIVS